MGDYDRKPQEAPSLFLRLKSKKESCRIRIMTAPLREPKIWFEGQDKTPPMKPEGVALLTKGQWATVMRDPTYRVSEVFHFLVIDRTDGQAKIFTTTGGVYGKIRQFAQDAEWGDPIQYDLTVTRTENPGKNYYEVVPSPNKSAPTIAERAKIDAIDTNEKLPAAIRASQPQLDDITDDQEPEPMFGAPNSPVAQEAPPQDNIPMEAYNENETSPNDDEELPPELQ